MFGELYPQSTYYSLEITDRKAFLRLASESINDEDIYLCERMAELGAFNVECNGHFGSAVHYALYADDDTPETHRLIRNLLLKLSKEENHEYT